MRNSKAILLLLLIIAFIPYLYTCFYALPFADDFCFGWTASEKISFAQKFLKQYLHWNGRFTSDILVNFHPLITGSLIHYQLVSFAAILAFPCVIYLFIRQWFTGFITQVLTAMLFSLFYLCYQPNITEGVYWYIGVVNYHLAALSFILQITVFIKLLKPESTKILLWPASVLLLIFSVGFNEVAAALVPACYLAAFVYARAKQTPRSISSGIAVHFVIAFVASLFVVFSPGNCLRANLFSDRYNIPHSLLYASLQTIRFTGFWFLSVPFIVLSLLVAANADKVKADVIKTIDYRILFAMLLFTVFMGAFLPYVATGILGQHRTINYVFPYFIILWLATLISISQKYQLHQKLASVINGSRSALLVIASVIIMAFSGNSLKIIRDIRSSVFQNYKTEFMQRQQLIISQPSAPIAPLKNIPTSFQVVDAKNDTASWIDKCMKRYYAETGLMLR